jgi:hypothetical protein
MDIDDLRKKRQLNVQERNALEKQSILETAQSFRAGKSQVLWVAAVLKRAGLDLARGILARVSSTPCGGREESANAQWVTSDGTFYTIEAIVALERGLGFWLLEVLVLITRCGLR